MAKCFKITVTQYAKLFGQGEARESKDHFIWCSDETDMVKFATKVNVALTKSLPMSDRQWRATRTGFSGHISLDRAGMITPVVSFGRSCSPEMKATTLDVLNQRFVR